MGYYLGYYLGYYMGYYMGYGGPVGVSGWGGPADTPVCCRRWERCFALRLDDSSTLPATTWATSWVRSISAAWMRRSVGRVAGGVAPAEMPAATGHALAL